MKPLLVTILVCGLMFAFVQPDMESSAQELTTESVVDQAVNLMRTAKFSASSTWDETTYTAAKAFDGLLTTRWNSSSGDAQGAWLAGQWDQSVTVQQVVVRQAFDRITGIELQVVNKRNRNKTWRTIHVLAGEQLERMKRGRAGQTPNDPSVNPTFVLRLRTPVRTRGLRLLVTSVVRMQPGSVSILEFEAFEKLSEVTPRITPEVIAAWRNAGAQFWAKSESRNVPAFHFKQFPDVKLASLPQPEAPFGLSYRSATADELKQLAGLTRLQSLSLELHLQLTEAELKEVGKLIKLRSLSLRSTNVKDTWLKELVGLKALRKLDLYSTKVTDAGLKELAGMQQLQSLSLGFAKITDAGLKELVGLVQLHTLDLSLAQVTDAGLKELASLKQLQSLNLFRTMVTDAGLTELAGLTQLKSLNLHGTRVTDEGLRELARMGQLRELYLNDTRITGAGAKELAALKQLQTLGISGPRLEGMDTALKELTDLKQLQALYLSSRHVTDAGLKEIAELKQLQTLYLDGASVTDAGVKDLVVLARLHNLSLSGTQITDAGLNELSSMTQLQRLWLRGTQVTDAGVQELRKALPKTMIRH